MADATAPIAFPDRQTDRKRYLTFTVTAGQTIYQGTYVALVAAGTASNGGDDASTQFVGIAEHDATGGEQITVAYGHQVLATLGASGGAAANLGGDMNLVDNQTLDDDAATTNDVKAGVLVQRVSDTQGWVQVLAYGLLS